MQNDVVASIMEEYEQKHELYDDFRKKVERLVRELLEEKGLGVHFIESRPKDAAKLRDKVRRAEGKYSKLGDVTDIAGVRIITYLEQDVYPIAEVIQEEFDIDWENSVDKGDLLEPDQFGYRSLHYVAKLSADRSKLTEYSRFSECKVEVQIRSILQHAWAEIEHDLGYKSKHAVPKEMQRRFHLAAAQLESVDRQLNQIRDSLEEYEKAVPELITDAPASVSIDQASLDAFIESSPRVQELDTRIASAAEGEIVRYEGYGALLIDRLHYVGLETIADIDSALKEFGDIVVHMGQLSIGSSGSVVAGISLFYLCYALVARGGSAEEVLQFLNETSIGDARQRESFANKVVSRYRQAVGDSD